MSRPATLITAEMLMEMAGDRRVELVRGEFVEMAPVGPTHVYLVGLLGYWLVQFVTEHKLGLAGPELGCILARNPDIVRAPDLAFVAKSRLAGRSPEGFFEGGPDLAVEVLSLTERPSAVQQKVDEYLAAGTPLVWVVDARAKAVRAHRPGAAVRTYSGEQLVTGEDVLPGFAFKPADLFRVDIFPRD